MLGKLTKYELKSTARTFLPLYGLILVLAAIMRLFFRDGMSNHSVLNTISNIMMIAYVSIIFATFVLTLVILIQRFQKNLLGDEGYLMHTLPVKPWQHIGSKLLGAVIWSILSCIAIAISVFILLIDTGFMTAIGKFFTLELPKIFETIGISGIGIIIELLLALFTELISTILMIYTAIAIGSMFNKNRTAAAVIAFVAMFFVLNIIANFVILIVGNTPLSNIFQQIDAETIGHLLFTSCLIINLGLSAIFFSATNFMLKKKLNLQ